MALRRHSPNLISRSQVRQCQPSAICSISTYSNELEARCDSIKISVRLVQTKTCSQPTSPPVSKSQPQPERAKKFRGVKLSRALIIEAMNLGADGEDKLGAAFSHRVLTDCESALCVSRTFHIMEPINSSTLNGRTSRGNLFSPRLRRLVTERDKISATTSSFISPSIH